jgi:hypothetical protein
MNFPLSNTAGVEVTKAPNLRQLLILGNENATVDLHDATMRRVRKQRV